MNKKAKIALVVLIIAIIIAVIFYFKSRNTDDDNVNSPSTVTPRRNTISPTAVVDALGKEVIFLKHSALYKLADPLSTIEVYVAQGMPATVKKETSKMYLVTYKSRQTNAMREGWCNKTDVRILES